MARQGKEVTDMSVWKKQAEAFLQEEDAVGVVEIILILVVLIGLVIIFKEQLTSLVKSILSKITSQSNSI
jgi:Flp pilus assembly pilin Flp